MINEHLQDIQKPNKNEYSRSVVKLNFMDKYYTIWVFKHDLNFSS